MRAIVYVGAGGTEVIHLQNVPTPVPGAGQIRVKIHAAGLNRVDLMQRQGRYPAPPGWPADIPGLEYAGTVDALGTGVTRWTAGDRVMGLVGGGGQAEAVVVHEDEALRIPDGLSFTEAAAIPEVFLTAFDALALQADVRPGDSVLIHAAGSGLGTAAIQVARRLGATTVIGTSRTADKLERAREYGLDRGILTGAGQPPFREALSERVDVVFDVLGGPAFPDNIAVLTTGGRLVLLGLLAGSRAEADLGLLLRRRLRVYGTVMRIRGLEERIALAGAFRERMLPDFATGHLRPVVGATFPMIDLARAHEAMAGDETFGKVVLVW